MLDLDAFAERAAIMEFDGGLSRFQAETEAARAQGVTRWQALEALRHANGIGHSGKGGNIGSAAIRDGSDDLPRVQRHPQEQDRPMPERVVPAGRRGLEMLALPVSGGGIL